MQLIVYFPLSSSMYSKISSVMDCLNVCAYVADLHNRNHVLMKPVLVINLEVKDNHEEAAIGGRLALQLCQEVRFFHSPEIKHHQFWLLTSLSANRMQIEACEDWEECVDDLIINFERQNHRKLVYSISYY